MKIDEKIALNAYKIDKEGHIKININLCKECKEQYCISLCPAGLYSINEKGEVHVDSSGCLECGTCMLVCEMGAIEWSYPKGGFGIIYRYG